MFSIKREGKRDTRPPASSQPTPPPRYLFHPSLLNSRQVQASVHRPSAFRRRETESTSANPEPGVPSPAAAASRSFRPSGRPRRPLLVPGRGRCCVLFMGLVYGVGCILQGFTVTLFPDRIQQSSSSTGPLHHLCLVY